MGGVQLEASFESYLCALVRSLDTVGGTNSLFSYSCCDWSILFVSKVVLVIVHLEGRFKRRLSGQET